MRLHTAPCLLCISGVSRTWSVVTMASPISSQWEEPKDPTPATTKDIIITKELTRQVDVNAKAALFSQLK